MVSPKPGKVWPPAWGETLHRWQLWLFMVLSGIAILSRVMLIISGIYERDRILWFGGVPILVGIAVIIYMSRFLKR